jgi:hypothetical protein
MTQILVASIKAVQHNKAKAVRKDCFFISTIDIGLKIR